MSIRARKLLSLSIAGICIVLASCREETPPAPPVQLFATDVHVAIGEHTLVLPFVALENFAYRKMSFTLKPEADRERAREAVDKLLRDAADPSNPLAFRDLSVVVRTYGWNDFDTRQREVCRLLARAWARSVCDNPWAAIQQALPYNRFELLDLSRLSEIGTGRPFNCVKEAEPIRLMPKTSGEIATVCRAVVYPMDGHIFHQAAVRIDGHLGALWTVWGHGQNGESAEAMADREGKAIVSFVQNALGASENFSKLHADMCRLRRPGSVDSPEGADCAGGKLNPAEGE